MYESFYELRKRPFTATPDADVLVETPAVAEALERIDRCVRQGCGIAVLTAAAGMGKTQLCHRLARIWSVDFRFAMLPNSTYPTRRGFLQAILAELRLPYQRLGETELRVELTAAARTLRSECRGVVLLLDEAHRYSERLLDEVRLIANLVADGEPLVRIVMTGRHELEERLSAPEMTGLYERVGEVVSLPRLTTDESRQYLRDRANQAGGDLGRLFTPEAADFLVRVCDGVPRCLNQLADHALLLGYVAERPSVGVNLVREALDDLKRLPLQWHEPVADMPAAIGDEPKPNGSPTHAPACSVIEFGGLDEDLADSFERSISKPPMPKAVLATARVAEKSQFALPPATEPIPDRFAQIDAAEARRQWIERLERETKPVIAVRSANQEEVNSPQPTRTNPEAILDRIEPLVRELLNGSGCASDRTALNDVDGCAEIGRIVSGLEAGIARGRSAERAGELAVAPLQRSIAFSELRRRARPM